MEHEVQQHIAEYFGSHGLSRCFPVFPSTPTPPIRTTCPAPSGPSPFAPATSCSSTSGRAAQQPRRQHGRPHLDGVLRQRSPAQGAAVFETVIAGRDRAVAYIEEQLAAGKTVHGYEVDDACRGVIAVAGYGPYFIHRTGHSLGPTGHYLGVNIDNLETQDRRVLARTSCSPSNQASICRTSISTTAQPLGLGIRGRDQLYDVRDRRGHDLAAANRHAAPFGVTGQS